jgi:hypothetical protein
MPKKRAALALVRAAITSGGTAVNSERHVTTATTSAGSESRLTFVLAVFLPLPPPLATSPLSPPPLWEGVILEESAGEARQRDGGGGGGMRVGEGR